MSPTGEVAHQEHEGGALCRRDQGFSASSTAAISAAASFNASVG